MSSEATYTSSVRRTISLHSQLAVSSVLSDLSHARFLSTATSEAVLSRMRRHLSSSRPNLTLILAYFIVLAYSSLTLLGTFPLSKRSMEPASPPHALRSLARSACSSWVETKPMICSLASPFSVPFWVTMYRSPSSKLLSTAGVKKRHAALRYSERGAGGSAWLSTHATKLPLIRRRSRCSRAFWRF